MSHDRPIARYSFDGRTGATPKGSTFVVGAMAGSRALHITGAGQTLTKRPTRPTGRAWSIELWVDVNPASGALSTFWETPGKRWGLLRSSRTADTRRQRTLLSALGAPVGTGAHSTAALHVAEAASARWHHVVLVSGSTYTILYVDGRRVSTRTARGTGLPGWTIGAPTSSGFRGSLDEVAVYNQALTDAQVRTHYQASPFV